MSDFLHDVDGERGTVAPGTRLYSKAESILEDNPFTLFVERWREGLEFAARWPLILHDVGSDFIIHVLQPLYFGRRPRLGDGKPIIIVAEDVVSRATLAAFATWLTGIGYRPVNANVTSADGMPYHEALGQAIRNAAVRTGRKVTIVALEAGFQRAIYAAAAEPAHVSAIVALTAPNHRLAVPKEVEAHLITTQHDLSSSMERIHRVSPWPGPIVFNPDALLTLSEILRDIPIQLPEAPT